jgi:hypothetical protein
MLVLWARSYVVSDSVDWSTATGRAGFSSLDGRLSIGRVSVSAASMSRIPRGVSYRSEPAAYAQSTNLRPGWSSWFGFQATDVSQPGFRVVDVRIPYWFPSLLLLVSLAWWIVRRRRQLQPGRCPTCGYDLRATPTRCPECGGPAPLSPPHCNAFRRR